MRARPWLMLVCSVMACSPVASAPDAGSCSDTCPGCCDLEGRCLAGNDEAACGRGGGFCQVCSASQRCDVFGCEPVFCPRGCVLPSRQCASGTSVGACGAEGRVCLACQPGEVCVAGNCRLPACGPSKCAGCCAGDVCRSGNLDDLCGQGGLLCTQCVQGVERCAAQRCEVIDGGP
ncbi:MAG: hypothetical protein MUC96_03765 [Myxococcaceae bacterium]|nr:hypothetical protein [Myxococcaceae bacterium]